MSESAGGWAEILDHEETRQHVRNLEELQRICSSPDLKEPIILQESQTSILQVKPLTEKHMHEYKQKLDSKAHNVRENRST